jgi:hypothetical protein
MLEEKRLQQEGEIGKSQEYWKSQGIGGDLEHGAEELLRKIPTEPIMNALSPSKNTSDWLLKQAKAVGRSGLALGTEAIRGLGEVPILGTTRLGIPLTDTTKNREQYWLEKMQEVKEGIGEPETDWEKYFRERIAPTVGDIVPIATYTAVTRNPAAGFGGYGYLKKWALSEEEDPQLREREALVEGAKSAALGGVLKGIGLIAGPEIEAFASKLPNKFLRAVTARLSHAAVDVPVFTGVGLASGQTPEEAFRGGLDMAAIGFASTFGDKNLPKRIEAIRNIKDFTEIVRSMKEEADAGELRTSHEVELNKSVNSTGAMERHAQAVSDFGGEARDILLEGVDVRLRKLEEGGVKFPGPFEMAEQMIGAESPHLPKGRQEQLSLEEQWLVDTVTQKQMAENATALASRPKTRDMIVEQITKSFPSVRPERMDDLVRVLDAVNGSFANLYGLDPDAMMGEQLALVRAGSKEENAVFSMERRETVREGVDQFPLFERTIRHEMYRTGATRDAVLDNWDFGINAFTEWVNDGRAVIRAMSGADETTMLHELGHVFRRHLPIEDQMKLLTHIGEGELPTKEWEPESEESFARWFTQIIKKESEDPGYLKKSNISVDVQEVMGGVGPWMRDYVHRLGGADEVARLTGNQRFTGIFDRLFGGYSAEDIAKEATDREAFFAMRGLEGKLTPAPGQYLQADILGVMSDQTKQRMPVGTMAKALDAARGVKEAELIDNRNDDEILADKILSLGPSGTGRGGGNTVEVIKRARKLVGSPTKFKAAYERWLRDGFGFESLPDGSMRHINADEWVRQNLVMPSDSLMRAATVEEFARDLLDNNPSVRKAIRDVGEVKEVSMRELEDRSGWPKVRDEKETAEQRLEKEGVVFPESSRAQDTITKLERGELVRRSDLKGVKLTNRQRDWMKANTKDSVDNEFVYSPQPGTGPLVIANSAGDPKVFQDVYEVQNYIMEKKYNGQDHFNSTVTKYAAGARDQWGASYFDRVTEQAVRDRLYGDVITVNPEARSGAIETNPLRNFAVNWSHPAAEVLQNWAGKDGIGGSLITAAHDFTNEVNALRASHVARINQIVFGDARHMWRVDLTPAQSLQVVRALLEGKPDKITDPTGKAQEKYNLVQGADGLLALMKQQFLDSDPVKNAESQSDRFNHADRLMSRLRRMVIKSEILKEMKLGKRSKAYENAARLTASTRKMSIEDAYKAVDAWLDDIKALDPDQRRARNEKAEGAEVKAKASDVIIPDSYLNTDLPKVLDQLSRGNSASLSRLNNAGGWGAINKLVDEIPRSENIEATLVTFRKLVEQVPLQPDNLNLAEFPPLAKIQSFFISGGLSGRAPLTNLVGTNVNHLLAGDYRSLIEGIAKLHADTAAGKAAVAGGEFGGISPKPASRFPVVNFIRSLHPFPITEKAVRRIGFEAGLVRTNKLVSKALEGDIMAMNDLKRYTNDYQRVIADTLAVAAGSEFGTGDILYKEIGLPKSVANVALNMSRESSLPMEPYMAPVAWVTSGTGRILSTFKRFGLRQWIFNYNMVAKDIGRAAEYYKENPELSGRYAARASITMAKTVFGSTVGGLFTDTVWSAITNTLDNSLIHRSYEALTDDQKDKTKRLSGLWAETMMVAGFGGIVVDILNTVTGLGTRNYGLTNTILGFNVSRAQASLNFIKNFSRSAWDVVRYLGEGKSWSSARDATRTAYSYARQIAPGLKAVPEGAAGWVTKAGRGDLDPFNQAPESRFAGRVDRIIDADSAIDTLRKDMMEAADRGNSNDVSQYGLQYKAAISRALDQANADGDVEKIARLENMMARADDVIWQRENWAFMPKEDVDAERKRTQGPEPWKWLTQYYESVGER